MKEPKLYSSGVSASVPASWMSHRTRDTFSLIDPYCWSCPARPTDIRHKGVEAAQGRPEWTLTLSCPCSWLLCSLEDWACKKKKKKKLCIPFIGELLLMCFQRWGAVLGLDMCALYRDAEFCAPAWTWALYWPVCCKERSPIITDWIIKS